MMTVCILHLRRWSSLWHRYMQCTELSRKSRVARLAPWLSTEKSTILDTFPKLCIAQSGFIIGHGHRLRNITGLNHRNPIKLAEIFLDLTRTSGEVETLYRQ